MLAQIRYSLCANLEREMLLQRDELEVLPNQPIVEKTLV
jgi:hypothetical protein